MREGGGQNETNGGIQKIIKERNEGNGNGGGKRGVGGVSVPSIHARGSFWYEPWEKQPLPNPKSCTAGGRKHE